MLNERLLIPIQPPHVQNILNAKKWIEVRKTRPKLQLPFRMYIYCTQDQSWPLCYTDEGSDVFRCTNISYPERNLNGKIVGDCMVLEIETYTWDEVNQCYDISDDDLSYTCLSQDQLFAYGKGKPLYGYRFSSVARYHTPLPLTAAWKYTPPTICRVTHAPQTWMYIEGIQHDTNNQSNS